MSNRTQFEQNYLRDITYSDIMLIFGELFLTLTLFTSITSKLIMAS